MKSLAPFFAAVLFAPASAFSFAHLWKIQEVYTDASGTVQFVEFFTTGSGETSTNNQILRFQINAVTQGSMIFSDATATDGSGDLSGSTASKTLLIGTSNLFSLYGVQPDYIIPANFLSAGSLNSVIFSASSDRVNLTNLPTNGVSSLDGLVNNAGTTAADTAVNPQASPKNFAGQTAIIPEPGTASCMLIGAGVLGALTFIRRRRG
jgi:hypothetical protein